MRVLAEANSLAEAAPAILHGICDALSWDFGALWALERDRSQLRCIELWARDEETVAAFVRVCRESTFTKGVGLPGRVWGLGEPLWVADVVLDGNFPRAPIALEADLHGAFGFPIYVRGSFFGVMEFFSREVHQPDEDLVQMLHTISRQIGDFIEWEQMERELAFQRAILEYQGEAALDAIGVLSPPPEMRILYWNQQAVDLLDLPVEVLEAGDGTALVARLVSQTADPAQIAELAQEILSDPDASRRVEIVMADDRVLDVWTAPVRGPDGHLYGRAIYARDISAQKRTEDRLRREEEWAAFIAEATSVLAESLDIETILDRLVHLAVPTLADWCSVHLVDADGVPQLLSVAHVDPAKIELARWVQEHYPADPNADTGVYEVVRTRAPILLAEIPSALIEQTARDEEHLNVLRELDLRSAMVVPIVCRGRALGAFTLVAGESGRRYAQEDLSRASELASRAAFPIDNARLYEETRNVLQTLQKSFLPPELPDIPGVDIAARYFPAGEGAEIGGDFYDAFRIDSKHWGFVLGDVSGKGLEAATVTTLARHTIRGAALTARNPSEALRVLNTALVEQNQTDRFCTAVYASIEPRFARVRVVVSCGGHPPPYIIRNDGTIEPIECGGTLLGFIDAVALRDAVIDLEFGDKLFLYTDGVLDIRRRGGMFGQEGLEKLLYECAKRGTEAAADHISQTLSELQDGQATDDIAFILMGVRSSVFNIGRRRAASARSRAGEAETQAAD